MKRCSIVLAMVRWGVVSWATPAACASLGIGDLVFDPTNWVQTSMTAIQTTLTAINTAEIIANQVLDLTGLEAWALDAGAWAADLQQIQALVLEAQGLAWDVESLNAQITALFGLEGAPGTSLEFRDGSKKSGSICISVGAMRCARKRSCGRCSPRSITSSASTDILRGIIGNKQGLQSIGQYQAKATQILAELDLHTAAMHRAQSVQGINDPLILQSIQHINVGVLGDWALGDTGRMRRLVMVLLGLVVMACLLRAWVWPLLQTHDVQRIGRAVSDWATGDNGDIMRRPLKPFNPAQPWDR